MAKSKKDETIKGDAHGKSALDQAKEAREEEAPKPNEKIGKKGLHATEEALTPQQEAVNVKHAERTEYLESAGVASNQVRPDGTAGGWKTGKKVEGPMYQGDITARSVSFETGEEVSARMHIPNPVTEEGVWYRFKAHHDSAMREHFEIDESNTSDPLLATNKG